MKNLAILTIVGATIVTNQILGTGVAMATVSSPTDTQLSNSTPVNINRDDPRNFCSQLATIDSHFNTLLSQHDTKLNTARLSQSRKFVAQFAELENKKAATRLGWDNDRNLQYQKLYSKATTDTQKLAIDAFRSTIEAAVLKRRSDVDSAVNAYRRAIEVNILDKQGGVNSMIVEYKSAIAVAQNKAQTSCTKGTDPITVREEFKSDIKSAQNNLTAGKNGIEKINDDISAASKTREKAIESAVAEFKATVNQVQDSLKATLKE